MFKIKWKNARIQYAWYGLCFGLSFPLIATSVDLFVQGLSVSWANIVWVQTQQPLHWIIDSAPIFLGIFSSLAGIKQDLLRSINQGLEKKVSDRTAELEKKNITLHAEIETRIETEKELIKAKDDAQLATKARSEFLSTMSHEIRTPLNAIIGLTDLLKDTEMDEEQREFVDTVHLSGETLLTIINDILDYSKIESGKLELEQNPFQVFDPVEDTFDLLATKANHKSLELIYDIQENVPYSVLGDITRMRQILVNLVNNAIKFTDQGEIFIRVQKTGEFEDGVELQFSVSDTGIGIPEDRLASLFESFSQVDASTTRKYGGTGLGLAICKKLVDLMKGRIWVESEFGKGATFYFTVRLQVDTGSQDSYVMNVQSLDGMNVFVVDDNHTNLRIAAKRLGKWGANVTTCDHPVRALEILDQQCDYHVAILDMHMPGLDGVHLARAIRKDISTDLPLIMLSSGGPPANKEDRALFLSWFTKPARNKQLFQSLGRIHKSSDLSLKKPISLPHLPVNRHKKDLRILLAEDNIINQRVATKMLERLGYTADIANNGVEAVEYVRKNTYDLILMDVQMPEMDGLEATQKINAEPVSGTHKTIIVAMTANATQEDRQTCLNAGMDDFLAKPVKVNDINAVITRWFYLEEPNQTEHKESVQD